MYISFMHYKINAFLMVIGKLLRNLNLQCIQLVNIYEVSQQQVCNFEGTTNTQKRILVIFKLLN